MPHDLTMSLSHDTITKTLRELSKKQLQRRDVFGRTILHIICITGRFELLKELLQNPNLNATVTDHENGWTGLHTSIYYGKFSCAKILLNFNYDLVKIKDRNSLTALDIYHLKYSYKDLNIFPDFIDQDNSLHFEKRFVEKDSLSSQSLQWWDADSRGGSEIYTYGVNVNNNLATGDNVDKLKYPVNVEVPNFRTNDMGLPLADRLVKPRIKDIKLSKNHSILLTNEPRNNIMICGNPTRGRLGTSSTTPLYRYHSMEYLQDETIVDVAVSADHSLALNNKGEIFSWGLNNAGQLGYSTEKTKDKVDSFSSEPRKITHTTLKRLRVKGVACSKIHNVAFSHTDLVVWGLNVGQMDIISSDESVKLGKFKGIIQSPRKIEFQSPIKQVIANNDSTIVLLQTNECHILVNHNHVKIQLPQYRELNNEFEKFRPTRFSKRREIVKICSRNHSNIAILYDDGFVLEFGIDITATKSKNTSNIKFTEIWKPTNAHLKCVDVDVGSEGGVVICTKSGCVFKRVNRLGGSKKGFKFAKIPKISKVVRVSCDELFSSFGFIRDDVDQIPLKLNKNSFKRDIGCLSPLYHHSEPASDAATQEEATTYTTDYLHQSSKRINFGEDEDLEHVMNFLRTRFTEEEQEDDSTTSIMSDPLYKAYKFRWKSSEGKIQTTFASREDTSNLLSSLSSDAFELNYSVNNYNFGKNYNLAFDIGQFSIGAHDSILKFDHRLLSLLNGSDLIIDEGIKFHSLKDGIVKVEGVDLRSMLILLHIFYTGELLKPWEKEQLKLKETQITTMRILKKLGILDGLNRLQFNLNEIYQNHQENFQNDVIVRLANTESLECCSFVLSARCEFFKTFLSSRWGSVRELEFIEFDRGVFEIVLSYIYGAEQLTLFDHLDFDCINDFVNFVFNIIELSDELLLFELKEFLQLTIKDFINVDNVLIILQNSETLSCQKLTDQCLYFIYHNFDLVLMDPQYNEELLTTKTFSAIDEYAHTLNKLNQVSTITSIPWYEDNQYLLISQFLKDDQRDFNDIFLEDDSFVPLFDIKPTPTSPRLDPKNERPSVSSIPSVSALTEQTSKSRKSSVPASDAGRLSNSSLPRNESANHWDSAIDFEEGDKEDEHNDFKLVINSRRRKSSANRRNSNTFEMQNTDVSSSNIPSSTPNPSGSRIQQVHPITPMSASSSVASNSSSLTSLYSNNARNPSTSSINNTDKDSRLWPSFNASSPVFKPSSSTIPWNIPSASNKQTPPVSSSIAAEYSTLSNSMASSSSSLSNSSVWSPEISTPVPLSPTPKISINRLSQKERRKLSKVLPDSSETKRPNVPWKLSTPQKAEIQFAPISTWSQPSLLEIARSEQLKEQQKQKSRPSLKGIIHEEEHRIILDKQAKSLAEVQQEEEFNLWWEAESKKVQAQLNPSLSSAGKTTKDSSKKKKGASNKKKPSSDSAPSSDKKPASSKKKSNPGDFKKNNENMGPQNTNIHNQRKKSIV